MRRLNYLFPYFRRYPYKLAFGILSIALSVAVGLIAPLLVGGAIDAARRSASAMALLRYGLALVGVTLAQGIFTFAQRMILVTLSRDIEFDLRNDYFAHLERLPLAFYQRSYTGDLMARATNDLQAVRMLCGPAIMYSSNTIFTAIGALFFMVRINGRLTLLALGTMPLVAVATQVFGSKIHVLFERVQAQFSALSTKVQEHLSGVRVVRAYAQESPEVEDFRLINSEYVERNRRLIRWTAAFRPLLQVLVGLGFVAVLWYGGTLASRGTISIGQFVTFNFFLSKLIWPMIAIGWVINLVQRGSASLGRILDVLHEREATVADEPALAGHQPRGAVAFRHLTSRYGTDDAPVLKDIDFEIVAGTTVALVGRTGSGKSTLLSLIPRLVEPDPGTLLLDGADVRRIPLSALRRAIAMVPQETFLFSTTVAENIALGVPEAERSAIAEAARLAGLDADLSGFPKGLDTVVGERGITLSGGQKQRVALARALLRKPNILLLDDCLSAVDTQTEERI
ncbi:MAG TPA: ABC transporter ATP-binding protein, partial [Thermoanaerobaculia bacterium]|nr:ABC transporter ATP-binding protein [Thermoanaerobaculia bacterium]